MVIDALISLYKRDIAKVKNEISSYTSTEILWSIDKEIKNSGGNLCFHLIGNLNHFIGSVLGGTGYVRTRDYEFSAKHISVEEMLQKLDEIESIIENTLSSLTPGDLEKEYPIEVFKYKMTTGYFLIHLLTHLNYHLGQLNYHRRLLDAV